VDVRAPERAGARLAATLLREGAAEILASVRGEKAVPSPQPE